MWAASISVKENKWLLKRWKDRVWSQVAAEEVNVTEVGGGVGGGEEGSVFKAKVEMVLRGDKG